MSPNQAPKGAVLVVGYFDPLQAEHARELRDVRERTGCRTLGVAILHGERTILPVGARAALAAALRMVDYVVIVHVEDVAPTIECLQPAAVVHLEAADQDRIRRLIAHVHGAQIR